MITDTLIITVGSIVVAAITVVGVLAKVQADKQRTNQHSIRMLIDQLQEENRDQRERLTRLENELHSERAYTQELIMHILRGDPPPPPTRPQFSRPV